MARLPIEVEVRGRAAVAIGAGAELTAKIARLVAAGARVTVFAERPSADVGAAAARGELRLVRRAPRERDLEHAFVVYLAPGDEALAARLHAWALARGRLLCTIDRPETSTFTNVAIAEAAGLRLTVTTRGASPGLARRMREDLEAGLGGDPRLSRFVDALRAARARVPRGERARRMAEAVRGFRLAVSLEFPRWFERGEPPP